MALLGFFSLLGMLIKNAIVLIDQINIESGAGKQLLPAIIDSGVSRLRPAAMAITIVGGLMFATVLTMVVVPVFDSIL